MSSRSMAWVALALIAALAIAGCAKKEGGQGAAVAKVGGKSITEGDMQARLQEMPPFMKQQLSTPDGTKRLMEALIEEELIYRDAVAMGLDKAGEFKKELERTRRDMLIREYYDKVVEAKSNPSDAEVEEYYAANTKEFVVPENVTARHILVKTRDEAARLRGQIERGTDFADLAGKYSLDASSKTAGGLIGGPIQRGGTVKGLGALPELVAAAFDLKEGELSQPIKTGKGFHLVRVEKRVAESTKSLEEAKPDIVAKLQYSKRKTVREETISQLKSKYKVAYMTEAEAAPAAKTPEEFFKLASEATNPAEKIKHYQEFLRKFPKNERAYEAKFMIGFTQAEELKDYDKAEKTFKEFMAEYPATDLSDDAQWMMANMRSGKEPDLSGGGN
ncbi:MAG: peptidyl-prolyl cis-trans isomerase [bacterium]